MAKKILSNGWVRLVGVIFTVAILGIAIVKSYAIQEERQKVETETRISQDVVLKTEGCMPARQNVTDIAVIKSEIQAMRRENRKSFKEIMTELKK